jgi:hypothetical protein
MLTLSAKIDTSVLVPSSVSKRYSWSIRTQGSSCRCRASSSLRRVSAFSASSSSSRAASHSFRCSGLVIGHCFLDTMGQRARQKCYEP